VQYSSENSLLAIGEPIVKEEVLYFVRSTSFARAEEAIEGPRHRNDLQAQRTPLRSTTRRKTPRLDAGGNGAGATIKQELGQRTKRRRPEVDCYSRSERNVQTKKK
jgi:hypothetical protein